MRPLHYRLLAGALALAALAGAWALYKGDFPTIATTEQKQQLIAEYVFREDVAGQPVILGDETRAGRRVMAFTSGENDRLIGMIQLRRGILGGWQPLSAHYACGPVMSTLRLRDADVLAVCGHNCPPEIAAFAVQANLREPETLMAQDQVPGPDFLRLYETDRDFFPDIHLYDARGAALDGRDYLASDDNSISPSIGSAETDMVYWLCAGVLALGYVLARFAWAAGKAPPPKTPKETA